MTVFQSCNTCEKMNDPVFDYSDTSNCRKKELKDELGFRKVPLFDYTIFKNNMIHRKHLNPSFITKFTHVEDTLHDKLQKNESEFRHDIRLIHKYHHYEESLVERWIKERNGLDADRPSGAYTHDRGLHQPRIKISAYHMRSLAATTVGLQRWMYNSKNCKDNVTVPGKSEFVPAHQLPKHIWLRKKNQLERLGSKLLNQERNKKEREQELPKIRQPCAHQVIKTPSHQAFRARSKPLAMPSLVKVREERCNLKQLLKNRHLDQQPSGVAQVRNELKRIQFRSLDSEISIQTHSDTSDPYEELVATSQSPPSSHKLELPRENSICIQITEVIEDNQLNYDMRKEAQFGKIQETTKVILVNARTACDACDALPCLRLRICPVLELKDILPSLLDRSLVKRTSPFEYLFGKNRVKCIKTRKKRNERHRNLANSLPFHPETIYCEGRGKCRVCHEDELYSRTEALYRQSLLDGCRLKAQDLKENINSQKLVPVKSTDLNSLPHPCLNTIPLGIVGLQENNLIICNTVIIRIIIIIPFYRNKFAAFMSIQQEQEWIRMDCA